MIVETILLVFVLIAIWMTIRRKRSCKCPDCGGCMCPPGVGSDVKCVCSKPVTIGGTVPPGIAAKVDDVELTRESLRDGPQGDAVDVQLLKLKDIETVKNALAPSNWNDVAATTELDPETYESQREWTENISKFYQGASFTRVADDNVSYYENNFVGLRRPQYVAIGEDARQIPDLDPDVLLRNKPFTI